MNILIINQPLNNRGDESAHKGLIRNLCNTYPTANIKVLFIDANKDSVSQFNVNQPNVEYLNLKAIKAYNKVSIFGLKYSSLFWHLHPTIRHIIKIYKQSDYIICAPGGICMGGFQNWHHLFLLKLSKYCNKPLIYYGRSFGPFPTQTRNNRTFKKLSLEMLHYFSFLSIRDKNTEKIANELNINYSPTVDSAFLDSPKVELPLKIKEQIGHQPYMVFVPNSLIWHYAYQNILTKDSIIDFYKQIISTIIQFYPNHNIIMLPQTFNYGTYLGDDINFFRDIQKGSKDPRIIIINDDNSSDIQQTIISNASFLIGARYHSIVFAINNNVPFIALSYEHKISGLLEILHKTDRLIDITGITDNQEVITNIIKEIRTLITNFKKDEDAKIKAKNIANKCFQQLCNFLDANKLSN